jgi:hypothetical protein
MKIAADSVAFAALRVWRRSGRTNAGRREWRERDEAEALVNPEHARVPVQPRLQIGVGFRLAG